MEGLLRDTEVLDFSSQKINPTQGNGLAAHMSSHTVHKQSAGEAHFSQAYLSRSQIM